ncbi:MAG: meso-butanediol dehydrogenase/(S,S)-butanediol dehydrogenase/diacetyl reductase, partial [Bermanella sp.]
MEVAIITGAGSGIGLATAQKLYDMGMAIVGVGRDAEKLNAMVQQLGDADRVAAVALDVAADDAPQTIVKAALDRFGRIDFLINNAGIGSPKPLHETDDEILDSFLG